MDRRPVKTSVPAGNAKAVMVTLADLLALPDAGGVTKNDKHYRDVRMPAQARMKYAEGTPITTTGWMHLVAGETDGDYRIRIAASATSGGQCLIVEVPNPDPQYVKSAELLPGFETLRSFIKSKLPANKDPSPCGFGVAASGSCDCHGHPLL